MLFWFTLRHRGAGGFLHFCVSRIGWISVFPFSFLFLFPRLDRPRELGFTLLITSARYFCSFVCQIPAGLRVLLFVCLRCVILSRFDYYNSSLHLHASGITTLFFLYSCFLFNWMMGAGSGKGMGKGKEKFAFSHCLSEVLLFTYLFIYIHIV